MYILKCQTCNTSFTSVKPDRIYCCKACNNRANAKKRKPSPKKETESKKIAVLDFETDPFKHGREVAPFAFGLMLESGEYYTGWNTDKESGNDFIQHVLDVIDSISESHIIYAHNGGRFDFFFLLEKIYGFIPSHHEDKKGFFLINNRITRIVYKQHEFRDSYSILPVPLKTSGNKLEMDYALMEKSKRNKNRVSIDEYLKQDCVALLDMVKQYRDVFAKSGKMPLTMASAAFKSLKEHHEFKPLSRQVDTMLRDFYAGGHTQCYDVGIIFAPANDNICLFDVNSEYPSVMKFNMHPVGNMWKQGTKITDDTFFIEWQGQNYGAVFHREHSGSINFLAGYDVFKTSIHEYKAALELGLITVDKIITTWDCAESTTFEAFVDEYFNRRLASAALGEEILVLFWKLVLNSAYGKFGQNAANFGNYFIVEKLSPEYYAALKDCDLVDGVMIPKDEPVFVSAIDIETRINGKDYCIIRTKLSNAELDEQAIYNVSTAASITGAARALLMRGIYACNSSNAKTLYVDTDSIFTYGTPAFKTDQCPDGLDVVKDKTLGKWNFEATGKIIALAGKKQYAMFDRPADVVLSNPALIAAYKLYKWHGETLEQFACRYKSKECKPTKGFAWIPTQTGTKELWACCKLATKGTRLAPQEIVNMAYDLTYNAKYDNFAPTFTLNGEQRFISRVNRNTAGNAFTLGKKDIFVPSLTRSIKREFEYEEFA
jgi:DNA-directed RNA polymerase subunit RPC12/RpoP